MRKNILTALVLTSAILVFSNASAQQTKEKQSTTSDQNATMQKGGTNTAPLNTAPTKEQSPVEQSNLTPRELAGKITEWMKVNIGTDEAQSGRINVASTNLLTKVREIRKNVTDAETRKAQIQQAMQIFDQQIKSVLKPEQLEVYISKRKDFVNDFKEMRNETVNEHE